MNKAKGRRHFKTVMQKAGKWPLLDKSHPNHTVNNGVCIYCGETVKEKRLPNLFNR